jgi:hypothetical protein
VTRLPAVSPARLSRWMKAAATALPLDRRTALRETTTGSRRRPSATVDSGAPTYRRQRCRLGVRDTTDSWRHHLLAQHKLLVVDDACTPLSTFHAE